MTLEQCITCEKHNYHGNGFVICTYFNINEQRTTAAKNNSVYVITCPKENDLAIDNKKDLRPRWK